MVFLKIYAKKICFIVLDLWSSYIPDSIYSWSSQIIYKTIHCKLRHLKMEINIFISISYQVRVTDCLISKNSHGKHVHLMKEFLVILTVMSFKDK